MLLVILIGTALAFFWATRSTSGTISPPPTGPKTTVVAPDKTYDGSYMTFRYKGEYVLKPATAQPPDLELASLVADTTYDKQVAVSVSPLPANGLEANGAYNLRKTYADRYSQRQVEAGGGTAIVWVKNDGSEQTAFIVHRNRVAMLSFSVNGTNDTGNLTSEVNNLLASFKWK